MHGTHTSEEFQWIVVPHFGGQDSGIVGAYVHVYMQEYESTCMLYE